MPFLRKVTSHQGGHFGSHRRDLRGLDPVRSRDPRTVLSGVDDRQQVHARLEPRRRAL